MKDFFSTALSLSAVAALSTVSVAIAQPAEAISVSRSANAVFKNQFGFTTQQIDFNTLPVGDFTSAVFNDDPLVAPEQSDRVEITDTSSGRRGNVVIAEAGSNRFFQFGSQRGNNIHRLEFVFDNPLAYFGIRFFDFGTPSAFGISFLDGTELIRLFTFAELNGLSGSGNYFNFTAVPLDQRFTRVVIVGRGAQVDDLAYRIPTPAMLPGLIGMGLTALRKRKAEA